MDQVTFTLEAWDYFAFAAFFAGLSLVGYWAGRRERVGADAYFLAGRKLPWYVVGGSFIASNISSEHFIGMIGAAVIYGACVSMACWGNIGSFTFLIWLFIPFLLASRVFTIPEFLEQRFNAVLRQFFAAVTVVSNVVAFLAAVLYGGGLAIASLFGWDLWLSILVLGVVAGSWAIYGGLSSVAWTDLFTVVVMVFGGLLVNRPIDWQAMFRLGLGQLAHAELVRVERPHVEIVQRTHVAEGVTHREVCWVTDRGTLRESFVGEWQEEYLVKCPDDYRVLRRAFEDVRYTADSAAFLASEAKLADRGITLGTLGWTPLRRTPLLQVQIDFAGPERFALDLADRVPPLMDLLDFLASLTLEKLREAVKTPARYLKLWENLSIDTLGLRAFREHVVPLYRRIVDILEPAGKRLLVHYDGKLRVIAGDIAGLPLDIDSFTPPPEGDMTVGEARTAWPDKFLWLHPPLGWYRLPRNQLVERIRQVTRDAGPRRYCLMISEDVPPDWDVTIPAVLEVLAARSRSEEWPV